MKTSSHSHTSSISWRREQIQRVSLSLEDPACLRITQQRIYFSGHYEVTDSAGHILFSKEEAKKGKFAFTTDDYEVYEVCFESSASEGAVRSPDQLIVLNVKHGVEAKNYEDLAKAEKLKPLEVELRRLEDLSDSIVKDFTYMKKREEEMQDTNESTSLRVLYFSAFSMFCLIALATWQVLYLRRFFKSKKLIE